MIYLAPIQGFTDYVYRKVYSKCFDGIDSFFIPYILLKNNRLPNKYNKEILVHNNPQKKVIPQVLVKDENELLHLSRLLSDLGYKEINLNLGCPYPMVTNRGKGSGLLPHPERIKSILSAFFEKELVKLSVKLRAGLNSPEEIEKIIPVLNEFPLTEVIFHPRIAKQLYSGEIIISAFQFAQKNLKHKLIYNGDIFSIKGFQNKKQLFPDVKHWMFGRGVLINPFLPTEIKSIVLTKEEKIEKLKEFHDSILEEYLKTMDNTGNTLNKMKQFWTYFSGNFPDKPKILKAIKKARSLTDFKIQTHHIFDKSG